MITPIRIYPNCGCCNPRPPKLNYNDLKNKPKLSGTVLEGNVPLKTVNNESLIGKGNIELPEGTSNYNDLVDRPTINGETLEGNVDLQEPLISGINIKTVNNQSILGAGNIDISGGGEDALIFIINDNTTYAEIAAADNTYGFDNIVFFYNTPTGYFACTHKIKFETNTTVYQFDFIGKYATFMLTGYLCIFRSDDTKEIHEHSDYLIQDLTFTLNLGMYQEYPTYAHIYDDNSGNEYWGYVFQLSRNSVGYTFKLLDFPNVYDVTYNSEYETYSVTSTSSINEKFMNVNTGLSNLFLNVPPVTVDSQSTFDYTLPNDLADKWKIVSLGKLECYDSNSSRVYAVVSSQFTMNNQTALRVAINTIGPNHKQVTRVVFNVLCERR